MNPDATRFELLRDIDRELTEVTRVLGATRTFGSADTEFAALEQRAGDLAVLRTQVESTRSPVLLAQLKAAVAENTRSISELATASQLAMSGSAGAVSRQTEIVFQTKLTASEFAMRDLMCQDAQGFLDADAFARRHGIDGSPYTGARAGLQDVAEHYRRKGDRVGGLVSDALISGNTADYWEKIAAETGSEEASRKAEEARRLAARADKEARDAVHAEVEKEAADRGMTFESPEAKKAWLEEETKRRHQAKKDEAIDAAVATGKMTAERGEELKKDAAAASVISGLQADSNNILAGGGATATATRGSVNIGAHASGADDAQRKLAANSQFTLSMDDAAFKQATQAAAVVAQDTSSAHASSGDAVTPGTTRLAGLAADPAGKSSVQI